MHSETSPFGNQTHNLNNNEHNTATKQYYFGEHPMIIHVEMIPYTIIRRIDRTHNIYGNVIYRCEQYSIEDGKSQFYDEFHLIGLCQAEDE